MIQTPIVQFMLTKTQIDYLITISEDVLKRNNRSWGTIISHELWKMSNMRNINDEKKGKLVELLSNITVKCHYKY